VATEEYLADKVSPMRIDHIFITPILPWGITVPLMHYPAASTISLIATVRLSESGDKGPPIKTILRPGQVP
jgi:hypothetical protein